MAMASLSPPGGESCASDGEVFSVAGEFISVYR
jgi:hypothetical protein